MSWPNDVRRSDLRIERMRGSGKGGQNRNKRDTAVRITHLPTGISVRCEEERTQAQNQRRAFSRLAERLVPLMKNAVAVREFDPATERVRTYHEPRNTVKDHRSGKEAPYGRVLDGDLECLL